MCYCLRVSRSSYYAWRNRDQSKNTLENKIISRKIEEIFSKSRQSYGARRIKKALARENFIVSRRRITRLMNQMGLSCRRKRRVRFTTDSNHNLPIAPNLLNRNFKASKPNTHYVGDITYIRTESGWLYLAVVIDLFSRKVVGWSMADHMKADLVNNAILMAIWQRKPSKGLISHTDRGSQYASDSHRKILEKHGVRQSMSRKGNCLDNAVSESFFNILKTELVYRSKFKTKDEAYKKIFEFIEVFYNRLRMHSTNNYLSPVEYEQSPSFH